MNNILKILGTWKFWKELFLMTLGMMIGAAAVYYFLIPSKLIIGSVSGLAIVVATLLANAGITVKVSLIVMIINAVLLVLAWLLIGKEFGAKTVYTALILGPLMDLWALIYPSEKLISMSSSGILSVMGDPWLDLVCFVLLLSVSQAVLFNINASTGGLDILAKIVNKFVHLDIGASVTVAGAIICCTSFLINPFRIVVIGLIGTWLNGLVVDYYTATLNRRKRVCIVSDEYERIRKYIIEDLVRGCSLYKMIGGYEGEEHVEIQSLLTKDEFSSLMSFIKDNNIKAFITAGNVSEVYGLWHKHSRKRKTSRGE